MSEQMKHTELHGRACPGCNDKVGITMADELYVILCGGNCTPHLYVEEECETEVDADRHGWTPAHQRCQGDALKVMQAEQN